MLSLMKATTHSTKLKLSMLAMALTAIATLMQPGTARAGGYWWGTASPALEHTIAVLDSSYFADTPDAEPYWHYGTNHRWVSNLAEPFTLTLYDAQMQPTSEITAVSCDPARKVVALAKYLYKFNLQNPDLGDRLFDDVAPQHLYSFWNPYEEQWEKYATYNCLNGQDPDVTLYVDGVIRP
jgi:hypothetical protein